MRRRVNAARALATAKEIITFKCNFCGGKVTAAESEAEHTPILLHEMPPCADFMKDEDMGRFLERNRRKKEG